MSNVIYKNFKKNKTANRDHEFFEDVFRAINMKVRHSWKNDPKEFEFIEDKIKRSFYGMQILKENQPLL